MYKYVKKITFDNKSQAQLLHTPGQQYTGTSRDEVDADRMPDRPHVESAFPLRRVGPRRLQRTGVLRENIQGFQPPRCVAGDVLIFHRVLQVVDQRGLKGLGGCAGARVAINLGSWTACV